MVTKEPDSVKIMQQCPRFGRCSAPTCPLDPDQDRQIALPGEPKCGLAKLRRHAIGKKAGLPREGLTKREWAGRQGWKSIDEAEQARRQAKLRGFCLNCSGDSRPGVDGSTDGSVHKGKATKHRGKRHDPNDSNSEECSNGGAARFGQRQ